MKVSKIAKDFYNFAKVVNFRQIVSHWLRVCCNLLNRPKAGTSDESEESSFRKDQNWKMNFQILNIDGARP